MNKKQKQLKYVTGLAFLAVCLLPATGTYAQTDEELEKLDTTAIRVASQYSSEFDDLKDFFGFEGIDYQKIKFTSPALVGKHYSLKALEIWHGEVRDSVLLSNSNNQKPLTDSIFELRVISKVTEQKNISMHIHMPGNSARKVFATMSNKASLYSLRNVVKESKEPIFLNKTFYVMAHILPIPMPDKPGWLSYCNVDDSGEDVRDWGKKLSIPHYIAFEMTFF